MRKTKLTAGHYYHLYNRGVNRGKIFFQRQNWGFFLRRWRIYCLPELADVIAYCLMPTHYHFVVQLKTDDFGHRVMQPFTVSYSKSINNQEGRVGPLFQGPFQAKEVAGDAYLLQLTRYVHLNPVVAGYVTHPAEWIYSSYQDYIGLRNGTLPNMETIRQILGGPEAYKAFVEDETEQDLKEIAHLLMD